MPNELQEYKVVYIKYKTVYMKCLIAYTIKSQNDKMVNMRCSWFPPTSKCILYMECLYLKLLIKMDLYESAKSFT